MSHALPSVEEYEKLIPVARALYEHTSALSWQMLLPMFLVSIALGYSADLGLSGVVLTRVKKLVLVALLLVSFPMMAEFCQVLGIEVARSIDDMTGIDAVLEAASKRADEYSFDLKGLLNLGSDFIVGSLVLVSYLILVFARFFLLAFQHFYWMLLVVLGPFMILAMLFDATTGITKGLFKNMIQVSVWPVIWSVLSAFLKALPFASTYEVEGGLITIITLNIIIAVALLFSPFIVSQLCEGVDLSVGNTLRKGVVRALAATNPKGLAISAVNKVRTGMKAQTAAKSAAGQAKNRFTKYANQRRYRK